jgi:hypothetical protein
MRAAVGMALTIASNKIAKKAKPIVSFMILLKWVGIPQPK